MFRVVVKFQVVEFKVYRDRTLERSSHSPLKELSTIERSSPLPLRSTFGRSFELASLENSTLYTLNYDKLPMQLVVVMEVTSAVRMVMMMSIILFQVCFEF